MAAVNPESRGLVVNVQPASVPRLHKARGISDLVEPYNDSEFDVDVTTRLVRSKLIVGSKVH